MQKRYGMNNPTGQWLKINKLWWPFYPQRHFQKEPRLCGNKRTEKENIKDASPCDQRNCRGHKGSRRGTKRWAKHPDRETQTHFLKKRERKNLESFHRKKSTPILPVLKPEENVLLSLAARSLSFWKINGRGNWPINTNVEKLTDFWKKPDIYMDCMNKNLYKHGKTQRRGGNKNPKL